MIKDTNTALFRAKAYGRFGKEKIQRIEFGNIRRDETRYAKIYFKDGKMGSYSYLTDLSELQ